MSGSRRAPATADPKPPFSKARAPASRLISAGTSHLRSGLLGADADGTDAYFFTRDTSSPRTKTALVKIYDAREGGGFPYTLPEPPLQGLR